MFCRTAKKLLGKIKIRVVINIGRVNKIKKSLTKKKIVTNPEEILIGIYDYVQLSATGNYLASKGDEWFYINKNGDVLKKCVDCSAFVGEYALAVEEDGKAYVIDTKFNKVSNG